VTDIDIGLLRTLVVIARTGSFSSAAQQLCKTQPAITHQMHRLEKGLETTLFQRRGRSRELTEDGARLLKYAYQALAINDEILRIFKEGQLQGSLRIGSPHDVVETMLPAILKHVRAALPHIQVGVQIDRVAVLMDRLMEGTIDLLIATRTDPDLRGVILRRSPTVWLCSSDYVHDTRMPLPLIVADGVSNYREMALAALEHASIRSETIRVSDLVSIKALVRAGLGVTPRCVDLLTPDMRILGEKDNLPALPDITCSLWIRRRSSSAIASQAYSLLKNDWDLSEAGMQPQGLQE